MSDIFITGVGMTQFGKQLDRSLKDLSADASIQAFADAGCGPSDIEAVFFGNCVQGHMVRQRRPQSAEPRDALAFHAGSILRGVHEDPVKARLAPVS